MIGENLHPRATDDLGWDDIAGCDAAYFTGGDPATVVQARQAPLLVVTARRLAVLAESGVEADVLIGSAIDPGERIDAVPLPAAPKMIVQTHGAEGGHVAGGGRRPGHVVAGAAARSAARCVRRRRQLPRRAHGCAGGRSEHRRGGRRRALAPGPLRSFGAGAYGE